MPNKKVFISYNQKDEPFVSKLYENLSQDGISCFFDKESVLWDKKWVLSLDKAIDQCDHIILILSPQFYAFEWIQLEQTSSIAKAPEDIKSKLLPLLYEDCAKPQLLKDIHHINVTTDLKFKNNYPKICELLNGIYIPSQYEIHQTTLPSRKDFTPYSKAEGRHFLNSGNRQFGKGAETLVNKLAGFPLALELARSYLNLNPMMTIKKLSDHLDNISGMKSLTQFTKKYTEQLPSEHNSEIVAMIQLSWDFASENCQRLIQCMSILAPTPIPKRLLRKIFKSSDSYSLEDPLDEAIYEGHTTLSLLDLDNDSDPWLHPLISNFVRLTIDEEDELFKKVRDTILSEMDNINDEKNSSIYKELEKVIPHADHILLLHQIEKPWMSNILDNIGMYYNATGIFQTAKKYLCKALQVDENNFEPGHPDIAARQSNLALIMKSLGELEEAKMLLMKALKSDENNFEPGHPNIAARQSNLALVLQDLGNLEEAKTLLIKALQSDENNFEPEYPSIAIKQSNLATILQGLGDLEGAKTLLIKALKSDENNFEPGHPSIATSQSNLAGVLLDLEDLEGAKALFTKALQAVENNFEPGHPSITTSQSNLAAVLQDLEDFEGAKALFTKALKSDENNFEPGHPSIATCQSNLALVLQDLGDLEGAKVLLLKALQSDENSFEAGHPSIAISQSNLALVLQDSGDLEGAKVLLLKALQAAENSFESGHPSITTRQFNLALILQDLEDLEGAKTLLTKAYRSLLALFGENHPHTKVVKEHLKSI